MITERTLDIKGHRGEPVANQFFQQQTKTGLLAGSLAVVLPGFGYNADMPVLFYPTRIALSRGADLLRLNTTYNRQPEFNTLSDPEQLAWLDADARPALEAGLAQRPYREVILIGKSLGTMAMGGILERYPDLPGTRWLWLTPVLSDTRMCEQIIKRRPRSLFVIGTADHYYDEKILTRLVDATQGKLVCIPDANHSLEIPGSIRKSIRTLETVMSEVESFFL